MHKILTLAAALAVSSCFAGCSGSPDFIRSDVTQDEEQLLLQTQRSVEAEEREHQQRVLQRPAGA